MDFYNVQHALVGEQGQPIAGGATQHGADRVAFPQPCAGRVLQFPQPFDPAITAQHYRCFFMDDIGLGIIGQLFTRP